MGETLPWLWSVSAPATFPQYEIGRVSACPHAWTRGRKLAFVSIESHIQLFARSQCVRWRWIDGGLQTTARRDTAASRSRVVRYTRYESSDRGSRWEGASDDRAYGTYRTDDRDIHDRHRALNPEDWGQQHLPRAGKPAGVGPARAWRLLAPVRGRAPALRRSGTEVLQTIRRSHPR